MGATMRNEVHVCNFDNGHVLSVDCWCEPTETEWVQNKHGVRALRVEHVDMVPFHHVAVLMARNQHRHLASPDFRANDYWITRALEGLDPLGGLLPPHEGDH